MLRNISKAVLITGCSTGIGRATALRLVGALDGLRNGAPVETLDELASRRCKPLALDVQ